MLLVIVNRRASSGDERYSHDSTDSSKYITMQPLETPLGYQQALLDVRIRLSISARHFSCGMMINSSIDECYWHDLRLV